MWPKYYVGVGYMPWFSSVRRPTLNSNVPQLRLVNGVWRPPPRPPASRARRPANTLSLAQVARGLASHPRPMLRQLVRSGRRITNSRSRPANNRLSLREVARGLASHPRAMLRTLRQSGRRINTTAKEPQSMVFVDGEWWSNGIIRSLRATAPLGRDHLRYVHSMLHTRRQLSNSQRLDLTASVRAVEAARRAASQPTMARRQATQLAPRRAASQPTSSTRRR